MTDLEKFKRDLAKELFGKHAKKTKEQGYCIQCLEPALGNCYSEAGIREFKISSIDCSIFVFICFPLLVAQQRYY